MTKPNRTPHSHTHTHAYTYTYTLTHTIYHTIYYFINDIYVLSKCGTLCQKSFVRSLFVYVNGNCVCSIFP